MAAVCTVGLQPCMCMLQQVAHTAKSMLERASALRALQASFKAISVISGIHVACTSNAAPMIAQVVAAPVPFENFKMLMGRSGGEHTAIACCTNIHRSYTHFEYSSIKQHSDSKHKAADRQQLIHHGDGRGRDAQAHLCYYDRYDPDGG